MDTPDIKASKEKLAQLRADLQANKEEHERRRAYRSALSDAINAARKAIMDEHDKLREASKAFTPGSPDFPPMPNVKFNFDELETLEALRNALNDMKTPFPPEHLAEKWAAFKARRAL